MPSPSSLAHRSCAAKDEMPCLLARLLTCSLRYCLDLQVFLTILSNRSVSSLLFAMLQRPLHALANFGDSPGVHAQHRSDVVSARPEAHCLQNEEVLEQVNQDVQLRSELRPFIPSAVPARFLCHIIVLARCASRFG